MEKDVLLVASVCGLIGCGKDSVSDVKVDYGDSSVYSEEEMDEAIEVIKDEFSTGQWRGFELQNVSYSSDDKCDHDNNGWKLLSWVYC